jgi:hypothetical protein
MVYKTAHRLTSPGRQRVGMRAKFHSYGESINVLEYPLCATVHVSQLPSGMWDVSEAFAQEWDEMTRELVAKGFAPLTDEPTTSFASPVTAEITGEFEIYYTYRVASFAQYDLTALEPSAAKALA